jgi:cell division protein FtsI (penicillin-binding protein 3)
MKEHKEIVPRTYLIYIGFVLIMLVVLFKTISIQFEGNGDAVSGKKNEKIPIRYVKRTPRRGQILDANYTPLVTSVSLYDIHMDPTVVKEKVFEEEITDLARGLAKMYPKDRSAREYENSIRSARERGSRYLLIRKKVTNDERRKIAKLPIFNRGKLKGGLIDTDETIQRKRSHGDLMSRTIGYFKPATEKTKEIAVGLEGGFNSFLKGEQGAEMEQRISTGWKKTGKIVKEAVEGADVVTSIDKDIQEVAHSELERQLKDQKAKSGCAIVMDVKTGFIKAIVNLSKKGEHEYSEQYNQAIGSREVPGSTFKLASLMAALEDEKINIDDTVNAVGVYQFNGRTLHDSHKGGYGKITIRKAFIKSSNVISKIIYKAYSTEPQAYIDRLESFGLTEKLNLDIDGEVAPKIFKPGKVGWNANTLPWMAIGYDVLQTPMQTLSFYNAVANNGVFVRPQFVKEVRRGVEVVKKFKPVVIKDKICSQPTLDILKECLEGVMRKGGTGSKLTSSFFDIAGKTGTAKILNDQGNYGKKGEEKYQASFVGYFPAKKPIYSCIVVVTAPTKDIYGATVAGTVFAAIANKVYATKLEYHRAINEQKKKKIAAPISMNGYKYDLLRIFKLMGIKYSLKEYAEWLNTEQSETFIKLSKKSITKNAVPNLIGLSAKDAVYLIESTGMVAHVKGFGKVIKQSIPSGTPIFKGGIIELSMKE